MKKHLTTGLIIVILLSPITVPAHGDKASVGAGIGMEYGQIGFNYSPAITENLYFSLGLGQVMSSGVLDEYETETAYAVGLKYYFREPSVLWRPRLLMLYGTNGGIERTTYYFYSLQPIRTELEVFSGVSLGFGQSIAFGSNRSHGLSVDMIYRITDGGLEDRLQELRTQGFNFDESDRSNDMHISIGYRFNF